MNLIALIDITNTGLCVIAGIYTLCKIGIFSHKIDYPSVVVFGVLTGTFAFMTNTMMAVMTIIALPITSFDVLWHPVQGYTFARLGHMSTWMLLLYLILHVPQSVLDAIFAKHD